MFINLIFEDFGDFLALSQLKPDADDAMTDEFCTTALLCTRTHEQQTKRPFACGENS